MAAPLVSVGTPFYNTTPWLGECIESVLAQRFTDFEYLLVNNRSDDGSAEIARTYERSDTRIRLIDEPKFLSQSKNCNSAPHYIDSESRFVKFVLVDDALSPNRLDEMVQVAERHPSIGIVSSCFLAGRGVGGAGLPWPASFIS